MDYINFSVIAARTVGTNPGSPVTGTLKRNEETDRVCAVWAEEEIEICEGQRQRGSGEEKKNHHWEKNDQITTRRTRRSPSWTSIRCLQSHLKVLPPGKTSLDSVSAQDCETQLLWKTFNILDQWETSCLVPVHPGRRSRTPKVR